MPYQEKYHIRVFLHAEFISAIHENAKNRKMNNFGNSC